MAKFIVVLSLLSILATSSYAQWSNTLGADNAGSDKDMRTFRMPDVPNIEPPFMKGPMPLSQTWDPNIAALGNNPDGMTVTCFAEDSDNLYVGGDFRVFDTVLSSFIVQYNRKTGRWTGLDAGVANTVNALALHNGRLYVAGYFIHVGSANSVANYITMWDGTSWNNLGGGMNGPVSSLAFIGDTLYAGGNFTMAGGNTAWNLAFWDGHSWHEASGGTSYPVYTLLPVHDSLFVGGDFNYVGSEGQATGMLVYGSALLYNGNWSTLGDGVRANSFAVFHDTLWAGSSYYGTGNDDKLIYNIAYWDGAAWQPVQVDTNIGTNGTGEIDQLVVVGDSLLALGDFSSIGGAHSSGLAMYHNGSWSQLTGGLYGIGYAAIPFNGSLYVGGRFTKAGTTSAIGIASLNHGTWTSLATLRYQYVGWQSDEIRALATTSRYVIIGGAFETIAGQVCNHVAAYDKQQKVWTTLGAGVDGNVIAIAVLGNDVYVGGDFNYAGSVAARHIAMYDLTTGIWSPLGTGTVRNPAAIATDGSSIYAPVYNPMVAGGNFYDYLGRWDGTKWNSFGNGLNAGYVDVLTWKGFTLYAAGTFSRTDDGTVVNGIAQIQAGGSWSSLNSGLNNYADALAVSGDSLYVGGGFTQVDGQTDTSLAVWDGTNWNPIGAAGFNGPVYALAADGKGGIYAGGNFSEVAQVGRGNLVHWNGSNFGTVASGVDNTVDALATDETALYAGGWFETAGSSHTVSLHFGALDGAGAGVTAGPAGNCIALSISPNPVSTSSRVTLDLAKASEVHLDLFNSVGSRIEIIANGLYQNGAQEFPLDATKLPSGIYFLRLTCDGIVTTEHFVVSR